MRIAQNIIGASRSRYVQLLLYKSYAELLSESQRFYIGYLWWIIEPIIDMAVYYLVFGYVLGSGTPDFAPFLLVGLMSWRWMQSSVMMGMNSLMANKPLMTQVHIPKVIFPLISMITNTFKFLIVIMILFVFLILYGYPVTVTWLAAPVILIVEAMFILALLIPCSAIVPFFPDFRVIADSGFKLLIFLSGVFYSTEIIPPLILPYFYLNPMANIMTSLRDVLLYNRWPHWTPLIVIALISSLLIAIGIYLLRRNDSNYIKVMR